jgi:hypothetical protein
MRGAGQIEGGGIRRGNALDGGVVHLSNFILDEAATLVPTLQHTL